MFITLDNFITRWFQEGYNFIWNHFGITRGFLCAAMLLSIAVTHYIESDGMPGWWTVIFLLVVFSMSSVQIRYHGLQSKGMYTLINKRALSFREGTKHLLMRVISVTVIPGMSIKLPWYVILFYVVPFILFLYLETCLVQDRELPEQKFEYNHGF